MSEPIRILHVEDSPTDAKLVARELRRVDPDAMIERVDTADTLRTALARGPVSLLNRAGSALDARSASLRQPVPGSLIPNYHVIADV